MSTLTTILQNEIRALEAKIQFLVDNWPADLEDGCITFPDGNRWDTTATANADQGKRPLRRPDERITKYEDVDLNESYRTGRQKRYTFRNGYGASVVMDTGLIPTKTFFLHGGKRDLWELAVLKDDELCYDTDITNDVIGHLNDPEVDQLLERIANLEETTV